MEDRREPQEHRAAPIDAWLSRPVEPLSRLAAAGYGALAAARACEELGADEDARRCRERAVEFLEEAEAGGEAVTPHGLPGAQLLLAETFRRLGRFEEAQGCCHRGLSGRPVDPIRSLLEFELELIANADTGPHSVEEVIGGSDPR
jgi:hypothetical protein